MKKRALDTPPKSKSHEIAAQQELNLNELDDLNSKKTFASPETKEEETQFTWRAAILGSFLGCFVAASNMYLGLKVGFTFGAGIFGAIFSFAIIKPLSTRLPLAWGGGYFGPKENVTAQTAATTSGGLFSGFISSIPALYKLGLMTTPRQDIVALTLFTVSAAFYGLFFAVPLRRHFVVKQDLTFPTPRASATTILSLHGSQEGHEGGMKKAKWMAFWFCFTFCWGILGYFVPFFDTLHIFYWIGTAAGYGNLAAADSTWAWHLKFDFPFYGAGLMTPGSVVIPFLVTTILVYGIIGPCLVSTGYFVKPYGFVDHGDTTRSFFLWPGIAMLVLAAFAELFVRYDTLYRGIKGGILEMAAVSKRAFGHISRMLLGKHTPYSVRRPTTHDDEAYGPDELVPAWWWMLGLILSIIFTCAIMGEFFGMVVYQTIVSVILAFLMAFVGIQAAGETDINPTGSVAKMSQLIFAGMPGSSIEQIQKNNLMAGNITACAAAQSVDMVGDLKTGQLVGASPRAQFITQVLASFVAVGIAVALFILFTDAYPCIITQDTSAKCEFGLTGVWAWMSVTQLVTGGATLSRDCIIVTCCFAVVGVLGPVVRQFLLPEKYHKYFPSLSVAGLAMVNSTPDVPLSMFIGWSAGKIWKRFKPDAYHMYIYAAAGGMIAGQGVSAILRAVFHLAGLEGNVIAVSCIDQLTENCP
ncbi:OPT oligopeptide transporter protein-domain-containing protein [Zychaea mexicana]|uniref:OPT oligopeptide transporter protein-domain-containing protein n=1 Tax=Zychaea mexicana TaxID=64656 RepID=UPI0022FDE92A|nr:OPT oligopeptide transporter protein-domain-containing protein [Zychaea mexicana]KAI9495350.1 OPT oligopeptide transporter protein-domain-containing protein [Zychaea mexicana]